MQNIRCVTYKDEFSAGNSAYNDFQIGIQHNVVGCGSKVFDASNPGDIVLINATKDKVKHAILVELYEKLESCDKWSLEGGHVWPYNWTYIPLTSIFQYDIDTEHQVESICHANSLNKNNLFNSRFCSKKLKPIITMLIARFSINRS
jgi:hypothetical protein